MSKEDSSMLVSGLARLKGRENYSVWKFQMKNLLRHDNLWCAVAGYPEGDTTDSATKIRKDEKALCKINLMIDTCCLSHVMKADTARKAWEALETAYEDKGLNRRVRLIRNLFSMKLDRFSNMEQYVNEIMSISEQLAGIGKPVDDEYIGIIMLQGLPEEYEPMTMALEHSGVQITSDLVKTKLLQDKKWSNTENNSALIANKKQFRKSKKPWCWKCKQQGHSKFNCPNQSASWEKLGKNNQKISPNKALLTALGAGVNIKQNDWYIDSGATNHMSPNSDHMENFSVRQKGLQITVANNEKLYSSGVGDVPIDLETGMISKISEVICVPNLSTNLLSVSSMTKKGYTVVFDSISCKIYEKMNCSLTGDIVATATQVSGVYRLNLAPENKQCMEQATLSSECTSLSAAGSVSSQDNEELWHRRLGHLNRISLNLLKNGLATGIHFKGNAADAPQCVACIEGKQSRKPFPNDKNKKLSQNKLDLVHSDLCGPMPTNSWSGKKYMLTFVDDHSRKVFAFFIKTKDEVSACVKEFVNMVEVECERKVKTLRTDNGTEYCNTELSKFFKDRGIKHQVTVPYSPQQNGVVERLNRTIMEKARSMMSDANHCDQKMWAEAANTAVYLINRSPTKKLPGKTPQEVWNNGKKVDLSHLRVFGSDAYAHVPKEKRNKLEPKSKRLIFVGYCEDSKAYRLFDPLTHKVVKSRDVVFIENPQHAKVKIDESSQESSTTIVLKDDELINEINYEPDTGQDSQMSEINDVNDIEIEEENNLPRYPLRQRKQTEFLGCISYNCVEADPADPVTIQEALSSNESEKWQEAMSREINSLNDNNVWILVEKPEGSKNIVKNKWVFKTKKNSEGETVQYKARLVAKGFTQQFGIDYEETYSPVIRHSTIRLLFALSAKMDLHIDHLDVETAFLNGELMEEVYMFQPEGFIEENNKNKVCLLKKAIYGLKQSSRVWNHKAIGVLKNIGYKQCKNEPCLFIKENNKSVVYIALYVDDFLIFFNNREMADDLKAKLKQNFKIKDLGPASYALGIKIDRDRANREIKLSQRRYLTSVLSKFEMLDANPVGTPLDPNAKFNNEAEVIDNVPYQQLIGSLMYLCVATRPDIAFAVSFLSQFNNTHTKEHWSAAKRVLRYLKGTMNLCLTYTGGELNLEGYVDADWANDASDRKSFTGFVFKMSNGAVSWGCRKQITIALSSTEAEYMAIAEAAKEALYLSVIVKELLSYAREPVNFSEGVVLYNDSQSAQKLVDNPVYHKRTKHIDVKYHYIREMVANHQIVLLYMPSTDMIADVCTKSLPVPKQKFCTIGLGLKV